MKNQRTILFIVSVLFLAALACSLPIPSLPGAKTEPTKAPVKPEIKPTEPAAKPGQPTLPPFIPPVSKATEPSKPTEPPKPPAGGKSNFPIPAGATVLSSTEQMTVAQVKMGVKDAAGWYRDTLVKQGLKERTITTMIADNTFSMIFDGSPNGMALVVQGTDMGGGMLTISIRYEKV